MLRYRLKLEPDDNGTVLVTSPDFPVVTYGVDEASALRHASEAIELLLASMIEARGNIPPSSVDHGASAFVRLPLQTTLKVELYRTLRAAGLSRADLQRRLGWQRESIDRLFRLDHNSKIEQLDAAFRALGKTVAVDVQDAKPDMEAA
ncbi:type II toxin-antitoxin system HicB family antitoxin [Beijerinckia sp. L45]|uniref:type II toxin-antitoxin system HicB family antitoxin n=1 Tax=Beijerinckia sp. L45 TaxID=1641855 RepID=UPI00131B59C6|nr:type II toxin-antitoxin system HicB family antitoxin [Beijerinckia sp. L45]